jgi:4'-phosphopantetheinyl transferase
MDALIKSPFKHPVHRWPGALPSPCDGVIVIALATDDERGRSDGVGNRTCARAKIRLAVQQMLGALLGQSPGRIILTSIPGHAPAIVIASDGAPRQGRSIGLSISHEAGLSLAAINLHGQIGVDLMRVPQASGLDDWDDLMLLARDYLAPACAAALAGVAPELRREAFASAWTAHEASLKCRGLALAEWHPAPLMAALRIATLDLPAPFIGSVATPDGPLRSG